jgi:hypothetical protein
VTLGLAVDLGGTIVATVILALAYGIVLGASGASAEEIGALTIGSYTSTDSWFFYVSALVGLAFSVLGGYVCARIARRSELRLGAILAAISAGIGLALGGDQTQLGTMISLTLLSIAAVIAGAHAGRARNRRADAEARGLAG